MGIRRDRARASDASGRVVSIATEAWCTARDVLAPETERERVLFDALASSHERTYEARRLVSRLVYAALSQDFAPSHDADCDERATSEACEALADERKEAARDLAEANEEIERLKQRITDLESVEAIAIVARERDTAREETLTQVAARERAERELASTQYALATAEKRAARNGQLAHYSEERARELEARVEALSGLDHSEDARQAIERLRGVYERFGAVLGALEGAKAPIKKTTRRTKKSGVLP